MFRWKGTAFSCKTWTNCYICKLSAKSASTYLSEFTLPFWKSVKTKWSDALIYTVRFVSKTLVSLRTHNHNHNKFTRLIGSKPGYLSPQRSASSWGVQNLRAAHPWLDSRESASTLTFEEHTPLHHTRPRRIASFADSLFGRTCDSKVSLRTGSCSYLPFNLKTFQDWPLLRE